MIPHRVYDDPRRTYGFGYATKAWEYISGCSTKIENRFDLASLVAGGIEDRMCFVNWVRGHIGNDCFSGGPGDEWHVVEAKRDILEGGDAADLMAGGQDDDAHVVNDMLGGVDLRLLGNLPCMAVGDHGESRDNAPRGNALDRRRAIDAKTNLILARETLCPARIPGGQPK